MGERPRGPTAENQTDRAAGDARGQRAQVISRMCGADNIHRSRGYQFLPRATMFSSGGLPCQDDVGARRLGRQRLRRSAGSLATSTTRSADRKQKSCQAGEGWRRLVSNVGRRAAHRSRLSAETVSVSTAPLSQLSLNGPAESDDWSGVPRATRMVTERKPA
jgi:hypothetical protein